MFDKIKEGQLFRQDKAGKNVFYPWGYPGESFLVSERQKNLLQYFHLSVLVFLLLLSIGVSEIVGSAVSIFLYVVIIAVVPVFYYLFVYFFTKNLEPNLLQERILGKPTLVNYLIGGIFFYIMNIIASMYTLPLLPIFSVFLMVVSSLMAIALGYMIILLKKTNGYLFQRKGYDAS